MVTAGNPYGDNGLATTNYNWIVGYDWTSDYYNPGNVVNYGQVFADGMGDPLSPGIYFIGVYNYTGTSPLKAYTLVSHGIGSPYTIPITPDCVQQRQGGGGAGPGAAPGRVLFRRGAAEPVELAG